MPCLQAPALLERGDMMGEARMKPNNYTTAITSGFNLVLSSQESLTQEPVSCHSADGLSP